MVVEEEVGDIDSLGGVEGGGFVLCEFGGGGEGRG